MLLSKVLYHTCFICGQRCKRWSHRPKLTSSVISDVKPIIYFFFFLHPSIFGPKNARNWFARSRGELWVDSCVWAFRQRNLSIRWWSFFATTFYRVLVICLLGLFAHSSCSVLLVDKHLVIHSELRGLPFPLQSPPLYLCCLDVICYPGNAAWFYWNQLSLLPGHACPLANATHDCTDLLGNQPM